MTAYRGEANGIGSDAERSVSKTPDTFSNRDSQEIEQDLLAPLNEA
jgi:hypothetical protein